MALTLTIGGTNFKPQYKTGSAVIRERLNSATNELRLTIVKTANSGSTVEEGKEIIFKDGSRFLFAGYVTRVQPIETGKGQLFEYRVEASDYSYILINKSAQKSYANATLKTIVEDLLSTYVDSGYSFTSVNVETGPTISTIAFNHISLRKAFEKIAKATGYEWYVDYEKDVHFFSKSSKFAAEQITDTSENYESVKIECDTSQVRNSIVVRGGREETAADFVQDFLGDGEAREWILREKPTTMTDIELDTGGGFTSQDFGVDPLDEDTGNDFMFNFQEKYVRATATTTTPTATDILRVTYKYEVPVIVKLKSASSIAAMAALEGGDGLHEHTIIRQDVSSKSEAREIGLKEITEWGNPLVTGYFTSRTGLLLSGTVFSPGQAVTVNLPTWGINSDTDYLIQEVEISMVEDGTNIEYTYKVTFGGRLIGIREFLEGLAGQEKVILDTEEIDRIEGFAEIMTIAETISREPNTQDVAESISIGETIAETIVTPPFKWAPYVVDPDLEAVWDRFEWG